MLLAATAAAIDRSRSAATSSFSGHLPLPTLGAALDVRSDGDFGDPYVLAVPRTARVSYRYVVYATANWDQRVPTAVSDDLVTWTDGPDALPELPDWALPDPGLRNAWGPSVALVRGRYVMYYTTKTLSGVECISTAVAASPLGPFVDRSSGPLVCQRRLGGSIDPSPVQLANGSVRLVWKSQGSAIAPRSTAIWSQPLSADGMSLRPGRVELLRPNRRWENGVIEGPSMTRLRGHWWLFFSANSYRGDRYATGVAACAGPAGPCRAASGPFLASTSGLRGPGGLEVFHDATGVSWSVFHTWRLPSEGNPYEREIHIARLF